MSKSINSPVTRPRTFDHDLSESTMRAAAAGVGKLVQLTSTAPLLALTRRREAGTSLRLTLHQCRLLSAAIPNVPPSSDLEASPHFFLVRDVISREEETVLLAYLEPLLRRRRYEDGHWDSVISSYKEVELLAVSRGKPMPAEVQSILQRIQELIQQNYSFPVLQFLAPHCIDLSATAGAIDYHVDSVKHSGGVLAGLSLLAQRTMRLKPDDASDEGSANANRGLEDILERGVVWSAMEVRHLLQLVEEHSHYSDSPDAVKEAHAAAPSTNWQAVADSLNCADDEAKDKKFLRGPTECRAKVRALRLAEGSALRGAADVSATAAGDDGGEGGEGGDVLHVVLPQRSLYLLDGPLRYSYAHAIDSGDRRLSVIFRDPHDESRGAVEDTGGLLKVLP